MNKKIAIIARDYAEALHYVYRNNLQSYTYIRDAEALRGISAGGMQFLILLGAYDRKDFKDIFKALRVIYMHSERNSDIERLTLYRLLYK